MSSRTHVVAPGESLIAIAKRHGVTLKALLAANTNITDPNRIRVGQSIAVPAGHVVVPEPALQLPGLLPGGPPMSVPVMPRLPAEDEHAFAAMDKRSKARALHPVFRERLVMLAGMLARRGMKALITDGLRTFEEQDALYAKGRRGIAGEKRVTNAKGGQSNHNYGIAVDMYPVLPDASGHEKVFTSIPSNASVEFARAFTETQHAIGEEAESLGLFWGARFMGIVDTPHIQLFPQHEMSPKECLDLYRRNGNAMRAVWDECTRRVRPLGR